MSLHTSMTLPQLERAMREAAWRETTELRAEIQRLQGELHQLRRTRIIQGRQVCLYRALARRLFRRLKAREAA